MDIKDLVVWRNRYQRLKQKGFSKMAFVNFGCAFKMELGEHICSNLKDSEVLDLLRLEKFDEVAKIIAKAKGE